MQQILLTSSFKNYWEVTKPNILSLLIFTSVATMLIASQKTGTPIFVPTLLTALASITLGCAGCNVLTCYIDRDIDAKMNRTKHRPIPSGRIYPAERALYFGLIITGISLGLALLINRLSFIFLLIGVIDNVIIYSLLLKRRNYLNIILGGFSGAMPVLFGWAAITDRISMTAILLGTLVFFWIPSHIWSLALFFKDQYSKAGVPMLPVVASLGTSLRAIVLAVIAMIPFSFAVYYYGNFGLIYLVTSIVLAAVIVAGGLYLFYRPSRARAWTLFKISSPYLFLIFLAAVIDAAIYA